MIENAGLWESNAMVVPDLRCFKKISSWQAPTNHFTRHQLLLSATHSIAQSGGR
jgi:hypothetical protein